MSIEVHKERLFDKRVMEYRHLLWLFHCASFADYFGADQFLDSLEYIIKRLLINGPINRYGAVVSATRRNGCLSKMELFQEFIDPLM